MPQTATPGTEAAPGTRLRWWTELPLILLVYACYSAGRLLAPRRCVRRPSTTAWRSCASRRPCNINAEHPLNRLFTTRGVDRHTGRLLVRVAALRWSPRRPGLAVQAAGTVHYRVARTWLMTSTFIGLIGFTLLPTCPPRLLDASHGFVDTMAQYSSYGWWGGEASAPRGMGGMTNQYAAMPSLHVGWALWCGVMLWRHGRTRMAKTAAVVYPLVTTIVVMGTANHYFLDAVAGRGRDGRRAAADPRALRLADVAASAAGPAAAGTRFATPPVGAPRARSGGQLPSADRPPNCQ